MFQLCLVLILYLQIIDSFKISSFLNCNLNRKLRREELQMKWSFTAQPGQGPRAEVVGPDGEYYFHPSKSAGIRGGPPNSLGKQMTIPIFPYSSVLCPLAQEWVHIFEMRHRQMIYDVGDGLFGFSYFNQQEQKLALVGTLARVKSKRLLEDGRTFVVMEGVDRFFLSQVTAEKPYFKAKVQPFYDYTELNSENLDILERKIFDDVRFNVKLMDLLFPQKNYTLSNLILENMPSVQLPGVRRVNVRDEATEMERRTKFSFAIMDMLQISSATKLLLLQDHVLEKRYARFSKVLDRGSAYLKKELREKGILNDDDIDDLKQEIIMDISDLNQVGAAKWVPENYETKTGEWLQRPTLFT